VALVSDQGSPISATEAVFYTWNSLFSPTNITTSQDMHMSSLFKRETDPVRKKLAQSPEKYRWSSAYAKVHNKGVVPDRFNVPVKMANPQYQSIGYVG